MAKKSKVDQDALIDKAWEYLEDAITYGEIKLPGMNVAMKLEVDHVVRICQWLATRTPKKFKSTSSIEDFLEDGDGQGV